ncbi:hypothetical protein BB560_003044 [Smittium megazygosporum]|uniref:BAG domain-containing protein n=1 Tax=Smittium megazygosporum TaxID=133381 RepID=A0A2T9ZD41_9FUNG|nr:hypothetical protein BB560_003044 [Smittium megazygosporum]
MEYYFKDDSTPLFFISSNPEGMNQSDLQRFFSPSRTSRTSADQSSHLKPFRHQHHAQQKEKKEHVNPDTSALEYLRSEYLGSEIDKIQRQQSEIMKRKILAEMQGEFHSQQLQNLSVGISELDTLYEIMEARRQKLSRLAAERARARYLEDLQEQNRANLAESHANKCKGNCDLLMPIYNSYNTLLDQQNQRQKIAERSALTQSAIEDFLNIFATPDTKEKVKNECPGYPSQVKKQSGVFDVSPFFSSFSNSSNKDKSIQPSSSDQEKSALPDNTTPFVEEIPVSSPICAELCDIPVQTTTSHLANPEVIDNMDTENTGEPFTPSSQTELNLDDETVEPVETSDEKKEPSLADNDYQKPTEDPLQQSIFDTILNVVKQRLEEINEQGDLDNYETEGTLAPEFTPSDIKYPSVSNNDIEIEEHNKPHQSPGTKTLQNKAIDESPLGVDNQENDESSSDAEFSSLKEQVQNKLFDFKESLSNPAASPVKKKKHKKRHNRKYRSKSKKLDAAQEQSLDTEASNMDVDLETPPSKPESNQHTVSNTWELEESDSDQDQTESAQETEAREAEEIELQKNIADSLSQVEKINKKVDNIHKKHEKQVFSTPLEFRVDENGFLSVAYNKTTKMFHHYAEQLLQCLEQLDYINSYGSETVRTPRKQLVLKIQSLLNELDSYQESQRADYSSLVNAK